MAAAARIRPDDGPFPAMIYRVLADICVLFHLLFILFAGFGALLAWRRPWLAWLQIPAALWGAGIEIAGTLCPLTILENRFREKGDLAGYQESFIDHYLMPLVYPELLFPQGVPRPVFIGLGVLVLLGNALVYGVLFRQWRRQKKCGSSLG
ncbi:DUF2784 domain-containing protein [Thiovibrio sp. JS02]